MASRSEPADVAAEVVALAESRSPTLGRGRLVCVDGPAGSGKTTLAHHIGRLTGGLVIHMDDLYDGWTGMNALTEQIPAILDPLTQGFPGRYRRYDWVAEEYAESVTVPPGAWLVLEGVGSGSLLRAPLCTVLVVVTAPAGLRLERGIARDGAEALPHWKRWMADEAALFDRERPAERADVLVDGTGDTAPVIARA